MLRLLFKRIYSTQGILGIGVIMVCLLSFAVINQCERIGKFKQEQLNVKTQIDDIEMFITQHPKIANDAIIIEKNSLMLNRILPEKLAIDEFITQLTMISSASDIKLVSLKTGQVTRVEPVETLPVQISIEGSYLGILNFVRQLYQTERFFTIEAWEINRSAGVLSGDIFIKIYAYSPINNLKKQEYDK